MSDFQPDNGFTRPSRAINAPPREPTLVDEPTSPPSLAADPAPLPDLAANRRPRPSNVVTAPRPKTVPSAALTTTGPLIDTNDIAAFIASAVMVLGPLAGGAFWIH